MSQDPRSLPGIFGRGKAIYPGGSPNPQGITDPKYGNKIKEMNQRKRVGGSLINTATDQLRSIVQAGMGVGDGSYTPPPRTPNPLRPDNGFNLTQMSAGGGMTQIDAPVVNGQPSAPPQTHGGPPPSAPAPAPQPINMAPPSFVGDVDDRAREGLVNERLASLTAPVEPGTPVLDSSSQALLDSSRNSLSGQMKFLEADRDRAIDRQNSNLTIMNNRVWDQRGQALDALKQALANKGTLRSSINADEQGQIQKLATQMLGDNKLNYQRNVGDINSAFTRNQGGILQALADIDKQEAGLLTDIGLANDASYAEQLAEHEQKVADINNMELTPLDTEALVAGGKGVAGDWGIDTVEGLERRIADMFANRGIDPLTGRQGEETPQQRYARIAQQILSGQRTLNDVRGSLDGIVRRTQNG